MTTRDARIAYWNRAAEELYGWSAAEARGHLSHDVLGTRFPGSVAEHEARLARDGAWQGELIRKYRDGTEIVVASRWALLRDEQGRPEATLEVSTDITAQERAEEERTRLLAAEQAARVEAEAARQRFQDLVQGLDAIVWEADAATFQFTFISQRAEEILGYPVEQWLDDPHFWADHIVPEDREWAVNYCVRCTNAAEDHQFEYRLQAADGRLVWMRDIPTADLPHVFERYRRASNVAGQIAGSGPGLAGAHDIVEQHGGTISAQSVEGQGTTFVLRLPLSHEMRSGQSR